MTAIDIITERNLKAVDRVKAPSTPEDYNYYVTQLVEAGRISVHDAVSLYQSEEDL